MPAIVRSARRLAFPLLAFGFAASALADPAAHIGNVTITRDDWGIAHIDGKTDADAVFGMIYAQAEDDFNRIETNYLVNLGRLAEAEGEKAIWQDLRQRLFVDHERLKTDYARSPQWLKALMQAWADGLNHYLATHPDVRPRVIRRFEPWMALSFTEGSIGGDVERVPLSQLEAFYGRKQIAMTADEKGLLYREPQGSNGIAIAPAHTKDGHALLLINPHTSFFFRAEQQVKSGEGLDAYGAATWGQFFIYQGFNDRIGWMHTSSGIDNVDEFAETIVRRPDGGLAYRYGKALRPVAERTIRLAYRAADGTMAERSFTTYSTHHGPIVREADGKWIATALMNRPVPALEQSYLRTKARDYAGFLKVAERKANSSNNTLFASADGDIAYLHPQFVPIRDDRFDYRRPVDGSDPATDWKGLHSLASLPQAVNPKNGWAFNTNNWPWTAAGKDSPRAADYPRYMDQVGENPRGPHAERVLNAQARFTPETLIAAAYDPYLTAFARLIPGLVAAYDRAPDPALAGPIGLLRGWDHRWGLESEATSLAVFWGEAMWEPAAGPAKDAGLSVWDYMATRASDAERLAALRAAVARLTQDFGGWRVPWGEINRYQRNDGAIEQVFDDARPSIAVPFTASQWGSLAAFGAKRYPGTKRYYGTRGNSFVATVEFGPRIRAWAVSAGGESGDPASPHFADQARLYAEGKLRPVYFYPDELAGHIGRRYRPGE
ncbi:penicillin acylase family protein [Edaphosphingomonas haloaromaticamans]|uniref:Glutaryl-7-aminocephalosporanic-acid acylase n=1 Tax=Edaphosphingomonas haloaromaticamans TaxID=653954 RepID=A0A1S1HMY2_9SPHN|nr:penicillin acylase family protein [Sphingomonas haloaromaticamans]OHT21820.1 Glutaryl-7-aminocephalosporanic-acid acylase precursor [Sphingomonas haloaromaticamans]